MANIKITVNPAYASISPFLSELPFVFDQKGEMIYDKRNTVKLFKEKGTELVVKRYKRPMFHQRIDYTFIRPSKAKRAYNYALKLHRLGVDTPDAVACVEEYKFGLFRTGYFVSTRCSDPDLKILKEKYDDDLTKAFACFIAEMHEKGILHGDLNLSNILYRLDSTAPNGFHFTVIDTNRSRFVESASEHQCLRNMVRISHDRELNKHIIGHYAESRGWDKDYCVSAVERMLDAFERKRYIKRKIKKKK